jgi:hypothetical protein
MRDAVHQFLLQPQLRAVRLHNEGFQLHYCKIIAKNGWVMVKVTSYVLRVMGDWTGGVIRVWKICCPWFFLSRHMATFED